MRQLPLWNRGETIVRGTGTDELARERAQHAHYRSSREIARQLRRRARCAADRGGIGCGGRRVPHACSRAALSDHIPCAKRHAMLGRCRRAAGLHRGLVIAARIGTVGRPDGRLMCRLAATATVAIVSGCGTAATVSRTSTSTLRGSLARADARAAGSGPDLVAVRSPLQRRRHRGRRGRR
jgi:hypothetical protein